MNRTNQSAALPWPSCGDRAIYMILLYAWRPGVSCEIGVAQIQRGKVCTTTSAHPAIIRQHVYAWISSIEYGRVYPKVRRSLMGTWHAYMCVSN